MIRGLLLILVLLTSTPREPSLLEVQSYAIQFTIANAGLDVEGSFGKMTAEIRFDPADVTNSVLQASVDVSSIKTGIELRDKHLLGREYFYAEKFPLIKLESKTIRGISKNKYTGTFLVTIRDITKEMEIPFSVLRKGKNLILKGDFSLNRLDFGIGSDSIILSDKVEVHIEVVAQPRR